MRVFFPFNLALRISVSDRQSSSIASPGLGARGRGGLGDGAFSCFECVEEDSVDFGRFFEEPAEVELELCIFAGFLALSVLAVSSCTCLVKSFVFSNILFLAFSLGFVIGVSTTAANDLEKVGAISVLYFLLASK